MICKTFNADSTWIWRSSLLIASIFLVGADVDENAIKCPLQWRRLSSEEKLPSDSVATGLHGTVHYIARGNNSDGILSGGRWSEDVAYAIYENQVVTYESNYEILTNPNKCFIDWLDKGYTGPNRVFFDGNVYIGRAVVDDVLLSGEIKSMKLHLVSEKEKQKVEKTIFQVMRSFSKGLVLKMTDFHFLEDNPFPPVKDFVGLDEIVNNGNSDLVQTVKFTKRILESTTFLSEKSHQHTISVGVTVSAEVPLSPEVGINVDFSFGSSESKEISKETETTIEITREVMVPPYTAVQVCSTVTLADNFDVNYVAKGVYTAPGLTPEEIKAILALDDKIGTIDDQQNVYVEETGTFSGSVTLSNQFITIPYDSPEGCSQLAARIEKYKKQLKTFNYNNTMVHLYYQDITDMIVRMTSKKDNSQNHWPYIEI